MISVEIRINGGLVAAARVATRGKVGVSPYGPASGLHEYEVQSVMMPLNNSGPADSRHFTVQHDRDDGALSLIHQVIERMMVPR